MPRSKDRSRTEREKLREMTAKEKLEYIRHYYGFYIIAIIAVLAMSVNILTTCLNRPDVGLSLEWSSPYVEYEDFETLYTTLEERMFYDFDKTAVQGVLHFMTYDDPAFVYQNYERLFALLTAGAIDIFIVDAFTLQEYSACEYVLPLERIFGELQSLDAAAFERIQQEFIYQEYGEDEDAYECVTGVRITDSPLMKALEIPVYEEVYLCLAVSVANYRNAMLAIVEFFKG